MTLYSLPLHVRLLTPADQENYNLVEDDLRRAGLPGYLSSGDVVRYALDIAAQHIRETRSVEDNKLS